MRDPAGETLVDSTAMYRLGDLMVDVGRARVTRGGVELSLPKLSFDLLLALIEGAPHIVSIDRLMDRVWPGLVVSPETVSQRVKLLRDVLGDSSREPRYVAAVRSRGYRLVPVAIAVSGPEASPPAAPSSPVAGLAAPTRRARWRWAIAIGLVIASAAGLWAARQQMGSPGRTGTDATITSAPVAAARSIAVLPFKSTSPSGEDDALAFGLAESVLHQLASLRELEVIARTSSFAFQGKSIDVRQIGRELNARYLVEGSVQRDGARLRVTAQLIDALTGAHVWSLRFDRSREDIFAVQDEIALQVARALRLSLDAPATDRLVGQGTQNFDAYLAFLQGRALLGSGRVADAKDSIRHFEAATRLDPAFAAAYVSLAEAAMFLAEFEVTADRPRRFESAMRSAESLVSQALRIDPGNGAAYLQRGYLEAFTDLKAAEASYRRGLALQPSDARGYAGLAAVIFEDLDRRDEALSLLDQARRLDPLEPAYDVTKSVFLLYERGDVRGSAALLRQVLERQPLYVPALSRLGEQLWCCEARAAEGIQYLEQALALEPLGQWTRRVLIDAYLELDDPAAARAVMESAQPRLAVLNVPVLLYRHDWLRAGAAAYEAVDNETVMPIDERHITNAIRQHARVTGDRARAIAALEDLSGVSWDAQGRPVLPARPGLRAAAIGLADVLRLDGQEDRAQRLARAIVDQMDQELRRGNRGAYWYAPTYPIAAALCGDTQRVFDWFQKGMQQQALYHGVYMFEGEPAFDRLRQTPQFLALVRQMRAYSAAERRRLDEMRAAGLVPRRS